LDSAEISLPSGTLEEAYDSLGNQYTLPLFVISDPSNLENSNDPNSELERASSKADVTFIS